MSPNWIVNQDVLFTYKNFIGGINAKYVSKRYIDLTNQYSLDDDFTLNVSLNYTIKNTTIGCDINKIVSTNPYSNAMLGANGVLYFVEAPCNFFIDITFKF